jgi:translation initiation factor IF-1
VWLRAGDVATVDVAVVDTSNLKDIAIRQRMQGVDFAASNVTLAGAASVLVQWHELQRKRGKVILRLLAELVFFLLCRE